MVTIEREISPDKEQFISLVRRARDGEREAFADLFRRYRRAVYVTAYQRLGNDAEAQELVQEVFIQAMRKVHQLKEPVCFSGWLRSIADRMAINRAVRARVAVSLEADGFVTPIAESETPLGAILAQERREQVRSGLDRLTDLDRSTLMAFYYRGRSLIEMSVEFGSPIGTIKRRLHVARKRLAKELSALAPA